MKFKNDPFWKTYDFSLENLNLTLMPNLSFRVFHFFAHIRNSVVSRILFFYDIGTLKAEGPKSYVTFGWGCYILENL